MGETLEKADTVCVWSPQCAFLIWMSVQKFSLNSRVSLKVWWWPSLCWAAGGIGSECICREGKSNPKGFLMMVVWSFILSLYFWRKKSGSFHKNPIFTKMFNFYWKLGHRLLRLRKTLISASSWVIMSASLKLPHKLCIFVHNMDISLHPFRKSPSCDALHFLLQGLGPYNPPLHW